MRQQIVWGLFLSLAVCSGVSALPEPVDGGPIRGLWWNPDRSGHGLDLQRSPDGVTYSALWYTYDESGRPEWLAGGGRLDSGVLAFDWLRFQSTGSGIESSVVGSARIDFTNHERAQLTFSVDERQGMEPLQPFVFSLGQPRTDRSGWYADPQEPGWGVSLSQGGQVSFAVVYAFDQSGHPRWATGQADNADENQNSQFELTRFTGDCLGCNAGTAVQSATAGALTLDAAAETLEVLVGFSGSAVSWQRETTADRLTEAIYPMASADTATQPGSMAFVGVNVRTMTSQDVLSDQNVLVRGDRIVSVADRGGDALPQGVIVVEAADAWLMPGLVDAHVHLIFSDDAANDLFVTLSHGVTSARQMWGQQGVLGWRDRIDAGEVIAPRILSASPGIEQPPGFWPQTLFVGSASAAQQAVRDQVAAGFDFIKVYNALNLEIYNAIAIEANAQGIPFVGHVSGAVGARQALAMGQSSIEHLSQYATLVTNTGANTFSAALDPIRLREFATEIAGSSVTSVPTLLVIERSQVDVPEVRSRPVWRQLSPTYRGWFDDPQTQPGGFTSATVIGNRERITFALWEAGARLAIGTDSGVQYVLPGDSMHEEMARYVRAGIPPADVLWLATRGGSELMGQTDRFGSIAPGLAADMLLTAEDPAVLMGGLREAGVMREGTWMPRAWLDTRLEEIAASYAR